MALTTKPVNDLSTLGTAPRFLFLFNPALDAMLLHILQVINNLGMVRDTFDDMSIPEVSQSLTGEIFTFETPGYVVIPGTFAKT